jgi:hypothetical protein
MQKGRIVAPRGERNGNAKLTWATVNEIRETYTIGSIGQNKLAKRYGVALSTMQDVIHGITWVPDTGRKERG